MKIMMAVDLDAIAFEDFERLKAHAEESGVIVGIKAYGYSPKRDKAFASFFESQKIDAAPRKKAKASDFKIVFDLTRSLERNCADCYYFALKEDVLPFAVRAVNEYGKECAAYTHEDLIGVREKIVPSFPYVKKEKEQEERSIRQNLEEYADLFDDSGVSELLKKFKNNSL